MLRYAYLLVVCAALTTGCKKETPEPPTAPTVTTPPGVDPNDPLGLGNPSGAIASVVSANNYLLVRPQYSLGYNNSRGTATWVAWHLSTDWLGPVPRCDCFSPDPYCPAATSRPTRGTIPTPASIVATSAPAATAPPPPKTMPLPSS